MFHESDFHENLRLVTARDLEFSKNADGEEGCLIRFWDQLKHHSILFIAFRDNAGYTLAQSSAPACVDDYEDVCEYLREPRVFMQEYKLPSALPISTPYLGPMPQINMIRILRIAQARLLNDAPVREDALYWLRDYYQGKPLENRENHAQSAAILSFPMKKTP